MKHPRLKPFWLKAEEGEMTGLWDLTGRLRQIMMPVVSTSSCCHWQWPGPVTVDHRDWIPESRL
eukprot:403167-Rhodomonas_salina.1